jgi:hypothetical protein
MFWQSVGIYVAIAAFLIYRYSRPQRMSVTRLWIAPIVLVILTIFSVFATQQFVATPPWELALAIVVGIAAGIPVGILRGRHSAVSATERPGVMFVNASWVTIVIWLGAFILRAALRAIYGYASPTGVAVGDGALAFAVGAVVSSYYVIYSKYRALIAA